MRGLIFAVLVFAVLGVSSASAAECPKEYSYAIMFKLKNLLGSDFPNQHYLSRAERGSHHWRLRKLNEWAQNLPDSCIKEEWVSWTQYGMDDLADLEKAQPEENNDSYLEHEKKLQHRGHEIEKTLALPKTERRP